MPRSDRQRDNLMLGRKRGEQGGIIGGREDRYVGGGGAESNVTLCYRLMFPRNLPYYLG
jgi:hypothetical protein